MQVLAGLGWLSSERANQWLWATHAHQLRLHKRLDPSHPSSPHIGPGHRPSPALNAHLKPTCGSLLRHLHSILHLHVRRQLRVLLGAGRFEGRQDEEPACCTGPHHGRRPVRDSTEMAVI